MSDPNIYIDRATKYNQEAVILENEGKLQEAINKYIEAFQNLKTSLTYQNNQNIANIIREKMNKILSKCELLKKSIQEKPKSAIIEPPKKSPQNDPSENIPKFPSVNNEKEIKKDDEKDKFKKVISEAIVTEKPNVKWSDVAGLEQAKSSLQEAVILPIKFPQFFTETVKPWKGILLYGPPGTGKSYLAKACATESSGTFLSVSSSDLVSKWLGESEKLIKALFDTARSTKPSVIFIDEIDSMCGRRKEDENDSVRRIKTEFLVQMQGVGKDDTGYLVLGATNTPWELDPAIRRRFEKKIYISLPEKAGRAEMFKIHIGKQPHNLTPEDFETLAESTEGYSGSDIFGVVKEASMTPIRLCQKAKKFIVSNDGYYEPTSISDARGKLMTLMQVPNPEKVKPPMLDMDDLMSAISKMKKTVSADDIKKQQDFTKEFGMEGN